MRDPANSRELLLLYAITVAMVSHVYATEQTLDQIGIAVEDHDRLTTENAQLRDELECHGIP